MITLYKQGEQYSQLNPATGKVELHYRSHPVLFSDMFPLFSGLKFDWAEGKVERNGEIYYFDTEQSFGNLPSPQEWMSRAGNSVRYEYYKGYMGQRDQNPSGHTDNVQYIKYLTKDIIKYLIEIEYDINDNPTIRRSLPVEEATAGDMGGATDDDFVDVSDRLPLNRLNMIPYYKLGNLGMEDKVKVEFLSSENSIFLSQTNRKKPIYTDGIYLSDDISRIVVQIDPQKMVTIVTFNVVDNQGNLIMDLVANKYQITYQQDDGFVIENQGGDQYLLLVVTLASGLDKLTAEQITQKALGITITQYGYVKVSIKDALHPIAEPIRIPEGNITLADHLPENTDPKFLGYVNADGESIDISSPIALSKDITITAVYTD